MQEPRERNTYQTLLQDIKPGQRTEADKGLSEKAIAAASGLANSVIVIDELDNLDSAMDIDAEEKEGLYFDYSRLIDIETLSAEINKLTRVKRRKKAAPAAVKVKDREKIRIKRDISYAEEAGIEEAEEFEAVPGIMEAGAGGPEAEEEFPKEEAAARPAPIEEEKPARAKKEEGDNVIIIDIPEEFKKQLAEIISIEDLGTVDLKEAEEIAKEDIFFLAGEDLREELKELDIVPEKDIESSGKDFGADIKALEEKIAASKKFFKTREEISPENDEGVKPAEQKRAVDAEPAIKAGPEAVKTVIAELSAEEKTDAGKVKVSDIIFPARPVRREEKKAALEEISPAEELDIEEIPVIDEPLTSEAGLIKDYIKKEEKTIVPRSSVAAEVRGLDREKSSGIIEPFEERTSIKDKAPVIEPFRSTDESEIEEMTITLDDFSMEPADDIDLLDDAHETDEREALPAERSGKTVQDKNVENISMTAESVSGARRTVHEEVLYIDKKSPDTITDEEELKDEDLINIEDVILTGEDAVPGKVKSEGVPVQARDRIISDEFDIEAKSVPIKDELEDHELLETEDITIDDEFDIDQIDDLEDFQPIEDVLISEEITRDAGAASVKKVVPIKDELSPDHSDLYGVGVIFSEGKARSGEEKIEDKTLKIDESAVKTLTAADIDDFFNEKELRNIDVTVLTDSGDEHGSGEMNLSLDSFNDEDFNIFAEEPGSKSEEIKKDVMKIEKDENGKIEMEPRHDIPSGKEMDNMTELTADNPEEFDIIEVRDSITESRDAAADLTSEKDGGRDFPRRDSATFSADDRVYIIDDEPAKKTMKSKTEEEKLSEIVSVIVDLVKGEAKQLDISSAEEETFLTIDSPVNFEDFHVEAEEKISFIDNDIDFVDKIFTNGDDTRKIQPVESAAEPAREKAPAPEKHMGIESEEMDLLEDTVFGSEHKKVDFDRDRGIIEKEKPGETDAEKRLQYILPKKDSLSDEERVSIEEDIKSGSALILEEDVEEIKEKLDFIIKKKIEESIQDITGKIRIIEDDGELKESIRKMVVDNKDDMARLIKYMDGLLDKLPESEIKSFADSEFYDLYLKVLKEMNK